MEDINLYELFDLEPFECSEEDIKKAYRKKALIHHPDKNKNNAKSTETFQKLSKALEILLDEKARASYDKILRAKIERGKRYNQLDSKRRRLKEELDSKETQNGSILEEKEKLKREIERIRKEGSKQLEEENILLQEKIKEEQQNQKIIKEKTSSTSKANIIKVKPLKNKKFDEVEITDDIIKEYFSRFGPILNIIRLKNSTYLEYESWQSLKMITQECPEEFDYEIMNVDEEEMNADLFRCGPTTTSHGKSKKNVKNEEKAKPTVIKRDDQDYENFIMKSMQEKQKQNNNKRKASE